MKKAKKRKAINKITPYVYLAPTLLLISLVLIYPIIQSFYDSFFRIFGNERNFVGFNNYRFLFIDAQIFNKVIVNNLKLLIIIPLITILAVAISYILFIKVKNYKIYQFIFFLPVVSAIAVVGIVFKYILRYDGVINTVLSYFHLDFLIKDWLGNPKIAIYSIIMVIIWKEVGFGIVLFIARLLALDRSIFDAAKIDGANSYKILTKVIIPQIKPLIVFYVIYNFIVIFSWTFGYIYVMTGGGPGMSTVTMEFSIYRYLISKNMPGMASALSVILFIIVFVFVLVQSNVRGSTEK